MKFGKVMMSAALGTLLGGSALAAERYVSPGGNDTANDCTVSSSPCKTVGAAVAQSLADDTIHLAAGIYREIDITLGISLSIEGESAATTIIDADIEPDGTGNSRIFEITDGPVTISKLTLRNGNLGSSDDGGAIYCDDTSTLTLTDVVVSNNEAYVGGALWSACSLDISNSTFSDNTADSDAGAIFVDDGTMAISKSTFSGNKTTSGDAGAVYDDSGSPDASISESVFSGNTSAGDAGALFVYADMLVTDSTFQGNSAEEHGGALKARNDLTMIGCTVSANDAGGMGGGLMFENGTTNFLINTTVSGNDAGESGGGMAVGASFGTATVSLHNVTVTDNTADVDETDDGFGGGVAIEGSSPNSVLNIENSIIAGNKRKASTADECNLATNGLVVSGGYNIMGANSASCDGSFGANDTLGATASDVINATLAANGGPTKTHALVADRRKSCDQWWNAEQCWRVPRPQRCRSNR